MCGRYTFTEKPDPALVIQSEQQAIALVPRYNIAPSQLSLISPQADPMHMHFYRWGLIPHWAKDAKIGYKMINARSETLWEKPAFRDAVKSQRCLVWGDGFYEWKKEGKGKQAYLIKLKEKGLFSMAGITSSWMSPTGETILTFSIITTEPNSLMAGIHDRMPVILPKKERKIWMSSTSKKEELQTILSPLDTELMHAFPVSPSVGNVRNDSEDLILPYTPPPKPLTLF